MKACQKIIKIYSVLLLGEYREDMAMMKVVPGIMLSMANINVAEVKARPSATRFRNKLPLAH